MQILNAVRTFSGDIVQRAVCREHAVLWRGLPLQVPIAIKNSEKSALFRPPPSRASEGEFSFTCTALPRRGEDVLAVQAPRNGRACQVTDRGEKVLGLENDRTASRVALWCFDEKRDVDLLFVHGRVFAKAAALAHVGAVIAGDDNRGIFAQPRGVKGFEETPKAMVHPSDFGRIAGLEAGLGFIGQIGIVARALKSAGIEATIVTGGLVVLEHKRRGHIPGFVGIETVDPQKEIVPPRIVPQELGCGIEQFGAIPVVQIFSPPVGAGIREVVFCQIRIFAQDVKERIFAPVARPLRFVVHPSAVDFCTADKRPGVKRIIKGVSTVDQVGRIVDELRGVSRFGQHSGKAVRVKRQGFPSVEGTAVFARHDIRAIGDRGETGREGAVKAPGLRGQPVEIGRFDPVIAIRADIVVAHRVDDDENDIHKNLLVWLLGEMGLSYSRQPDALHLQSI